MAFDAIGVKWFFVAGHVTRLSAGQRPLRCQLLFELFIEETTKRRSSFKLFIYCSGRLVLIELMVRNEPVVWPCRSNGDIAIDLIVVLWTGTMKCNSLKPLPSNWSMTTSTDVPPLSLSLLLFWFCQVMLKLFTFFWHSQAFWILIHRTTLGISVSFMDFEGRYNATDACDSFSLHNGGL